MTDGRQPPGTPEGWELDDLSRMRRVHDALEREYLQIPEGPFRHRREGSVPSLCERPRKHEDGRP
jgi:hypothetical protein